jgi:histidinol dehydrogenase
VSATAKALGTNSSPRMNRVDWAGLDAAAREAVLRRPAQVVAADIRRSVTEIITAVRRDGDVALRSLSRKFDGVPVTDFEVGAEEFVAAEGLVSDALRKAMRDAMERIERFHRAGMGQGYAVDTATGVRCERVRSSGWVCTCRPAARRFPPRR